MTQRLNYSKIATDGMKALGGVYGYVAHSGLPKVVIDLVYLRASQINGCAYCVGVHSKDLLKEGMPVEKLVLVPSWRECGNLFSEQERAALGWAEAVTRVAQKDIEDAEYEAVAAQFSEKELVDLTLAISLMNVYNRMAVSFRRVPDAAKHL